MDAQPIMVHMQSRVALAAWLTIDRQMACYGRMCKQGWTGSKDPNCEAHSRSHRYTPLHIDVSSQLVDAMWIHVRHAGVECSQQAGREYDGSMAGGHEDDRPPDVLQWPNHAQPPAHPSLPVWYILSPSACGFTHESQRKEGKFNHP